MKYRKNQTHKRSKIVKIARIMSVLILLAGIGLFGYKTLMSEPTIEEAIANELVFDSSVTDTERETIKAAALSQKIALKNSINVSVTTSTEATAQDQVIGVYVPVTTFNSVAQAITLDSIPALLPLTMPKETDPIVVTAIAEALGIEEQSILLVENVSTDLEDEGLAFVLINQLDQNLKLLEMDEAYYLDDFVGGAVFRKVTIDLPLEGFKLDTMSSEDVYKVNMTGVTALTRVMQRKLTQVGDPLYFSAKIGDFLADADLTHVSNEVSFKPDCGYSNTLFCSPPEFIETLKASGVDLVELTGNHNNDLGSQYNTETIELYRSLGWGTVGGGLNAEDAAVPYPTDTKDSKVTFLAYNYPDSPNGGAIAGLNSAGANSFDFDRIKTEIATAKQVADFVIVNVQYWECFAYPDGYIEYPTCDVPIGEQEEVFKKLVDLGANMVIGSSAHQPQTYELYNGAPIYYGLGNMYFEQTQWPGTERGIVLTHYFSKGVLLQTKLTPTVFDDELQTRVATAEEANYLLTRLQAAR